MGRSKSIPISHHQRHQQHQRDRNTPATTTTTNHTAVSSSSSLCVIPNTIDRSVVVVGVHDHIPMLGRMVAAAAVSSSSSSLLLFDSDDDNDDINNNRHTKVQQLPIHHNDMNQPRPRPRPLLQSTPTRTRTSRTRSSTTTTTTNQPPPQRKSQVQFTDDVGDDMEDDHRSNLILSSSSSSSSLQIPMPELRIIHHDPLTTTTKTTIELYHDGNCDPNNHNTITSESNHDDDIKEITSGINNDTNYWLLSEYDLPSSIRFVLVASSLQSPPFENIDSTCHEILHSTTTPLPQSQQQQQQQPQPYHHNNQNHKHTEFRYTIRTQQGAIDICTLLPLLPSPTTQLPQLPSTTTTSTTTGSIKSIIRNVSFFRTALGRLVEAGILRLELQLLQPSQQPDPSSSSSSSVLLPPPIVRVQIGISLQRIMMMHLCCPPRMDPMKMIRPRHRRGFWMVPYNNNNNHTSILQKTTNTSTRRCRVNKKTKQCRSDSNRSRSSTQQQSHSASAAMKQQQQQDLYMALVLLFPNSEIIDVFLKSSVGVNDDDDDDDNHHSGSSCSRSSSIPQQHPTNPIITAQQVYALTDNVQINRANHLLRVQNQEDDPTNQTNTDTGSTESVLSIPGLVPTLRPYQCQAVEWMLRRERSQSRQLLSDQNNIHSNNNDDDDEWELAWIVLSSETMNNQTTTPTTAAAVRKNAQGNNSNHDNNKRGPQFLPTWKQKNHCWAEPNNCSSVLLFCPFTGWMTNSIHQAKEWTVGTLSSSTATNAASTTTTCSGGILAESMGLGKTVEVLACILSNPRYGNANNTCPTALPMNSNADIDLSSPSVVYGPVTKRQLDFNASINDAETMIAGTEGTANTGTICERFSVGSVSDMNDFGDAENDSDDDNEANESHSSVQLFKSPSTSTIESPFLHTDPLPTIVSAAALPIVTPTKVSQDSNTEERWTDNDILGACICGNLIGFDTRNGRDPIIICRSCDEPMHAECAAFHSVHEMKAKTTPLQYRHTFTNTMLSCGICERDQCPCCAADLTSSATLIITPPAILNQWEREITRHTRNTVSNLPLRVIIYDGIKQLTQSHSVRNGSTIKYMHPRHLAGADIVLMTFDALMKDLGHTDDNQFVSRGTDNDNSGALRKRKRYRVVPSPLLSIKWWRVCLDEAQRVETPTAGSAQMALKLEAVHRWCISGTPIQRGSLNDLYGLLLFLRLDPFWDKSWFQNCFTPAIRNIDARIIHLLHNLFWRSTKASELVRTQMGVPDQIEKKIMLKFSSIEKHFYDRQLERTILAAGDVSNKPGCASKKESSRLHLLTDQLHKLRAACCHPQVGSGGVTSAKRLRQKDGDSSVSSRVMTMSQILDKFIDDAKVQCEESQRLVVLHTNGMAAISRLKVEAKSRGVKIPESDFELFEKCCQLYNQSLQLADENGVPTLVCGEVLLTGSSGFRTSGKAMDSYSFCLEWQRFYTETSQNSVWAKFDVPFGASRKLTQVRARTCSTVPISLLDDSSVDFTWRILYPKDCTFQCMTTTGEFVDEHSFSMPLPDRNNEWTLANGFRTNKSKSWRLVVKSFYASQIAESVKLQDMNRFGTYIGIEFECYEASIASDPLQRLHCLHNAAQAYSSILHLEVSTIPHDDSRQIFDFQNASERVDTLMKEASRIESLYLAGARAFHKDYHYRLQESAGVRRNLEHELCDLNSSNRRVNVKDCWDDFWWDDFLVLCHLYGNEAQKNTICVKIRQDLDGMMMERVDTTNQEIIPFPMFEDLTGLRTALQLRISGIRLGLGSKSSRRNQPPPQVGSVGSDVGGSLTRRFRCSSDGHNLCMHSILDLTENPLEDEIRENSRCRVCKADWLQTGPKCRHCKMGDTLEELAPDKTTVQLLNSLYSLVKGIVGLALLQSFGSETRVLHRAKTFFEVLEASRKERTIAYRLWRTHLNLLNDIDELNQCKSTMRLRNENEDVTELSKEQLNAVIEPIDVNVSFHNYAAKQAMALGALSRAKGTLQYLKNLSARERHNVPNPSEGENDTQTCLICLSKFDTDRAILRCGHGFHLSPCLEQLCARSGGNAICCPLRCTIRTKFDEVMIASEGKRHDDGSHSRRLIKGSYGTKVTRLVSDILDVCDLGEKGVVFSQWEDMLDICEHALIENGVPLIRVTSLRQIGKCTQRFREPNCSIMLLNVKNGAEGLTLVEATHVFMVEPLLNCGLDIQAINRIHRIGQHRKTCVWRYVVKDTVEIKIDKLRMKNQEDQLEDSIGDKKRKSIIQAGGIDGGFQSQEELLEMLHA